MKNTDHNLRMLETVFNRNIQDAGGRVGQSNKAKYISKVDYDHKSANCFSVRQSGLFLRQDCK